MARPICAHCGRAYGGRATVTESANYKAGEPKPKYRGNGIVTKTQERPARGSWSYSEGHSDVSEWHITWTIWDGENYFLPYEPFCTLRCALDYARKAYARTQQIRRVS